MGPRPDELRRDRRPAEPRAGLTVTIDLRNARNVGRIISGPKIATQKFSTGDPSSGLSRRIGWQIENPSTWVQ